MKKVKERNYNLTAKYFAEWYDLVIMQVKKKNIIFVIENLVIVRLIANKKSFVQLVFFQES